MAYLFTGTELINPVNVLEKAGIRADMTVADFGCGTLGHYVFPAAAMVGQRGKVYAVDILKSVLDGIEGRRKLEAEQNVVEVWGDIESPHGVPLPDDSLDIGLLINNLFMSKSKEAMVRECTRMVKHGGTMIIIDWKPSGAAFGPPGESRVAPETAKQLAAAAGLQVVSDFEPGKYHYGFVCRKP